MKVKILTFSKDTNLGANLQCYALSTVLKRWGLDVQIIDFQLSKSKYSFPGNFLVYIDSLLRALFRWRFYPSFTKKIKKADDLCADGNSDVVYIVGSDQVWNPDITKDRKLYYFFAFLPNCMKRIAYAASFGKAIWNKTSVDIEIEDYLSKFSAIGVREESGVKICDEVFNVRAEAVLDPTLLLEDYDDIIGRKEGMENKELVIVKFVQNEAFYDVCKHIAEELGLKPVLLNYKRYKRGFVFRPFVTVGSWLRSIRNSSFVVADSFHCMVFAIIFKRQFIVLPAYKDRTERITNLLLKLGLDDRLYPDIESVYCDNRWMDKIDYEKVYERLEKERIHSLSFLKNSIFG